MENRQRDTRTADVARKQNKRALKRMMFAGIQAAGGAALAVYTYKNSTSQTIWPSVYSVIAFEGTYNVIKNIRKIFWRSVCNKRNKSYSLHNVATGTIIYFGSLYAFSEAWMSSHKLWVPCLGIAASGFLYAVSSIYSGKTVSTVKPLLNCCQLAFEPALIVGGAIYLLHFRNHEEGWLVWFPLVATGLTGLKFDMGLFRVEDEEGPNASLLIAIEKLMGGSLLTVSSIVSHIYASTKGFHLSLKCFAIAMSFYGLFIIQASIMFFQKYLRMDQQVMVYSHSFLIGTEAIVLAFLMVKWTAYNRAACFMFPFLVAGGFLYQLAAVNKIREILPPSLFTKYCQRALGLMLIVSGSSASAYIGYRFGWRYSLLTIPFVPAGIGYTYQGLK